VDELQFRRDGDLSLLGVLWRTVEQHPDTTFLDFAELKVTYSEFGQRVRAMAAGLSKIGVRGRTIASMLDNSPESLIVWFAANIAGAIHTPLNVALKGAWLRKQLESLDPVILICDDSYAERTFEYVAAAAANDILLITRGGECPKNLPNGVRHAPLGSLEDAAHPVKSPDLFGDEPTAITFTSGTTAASKGCVLPHAYVINMASQILTFTERTADEICWTCLPLFHLNAMSSAVATMMLGSTLGISKRFSLSRFWDEVERTGAKVVQMLGSMPILVANGPDTEASKRCYGQVRVAVGAPIHPEVAVRLKDRFGIRQIASSVYGSTEASVISYTRCSDFAPVGSSGHIAPEFDVRIFDEHNREVEVGEIGEIVFRPRKPDVMFAGYRNAPEETVKRSAGLWWHTGDMGRLDKDGFLFFVEREKDSVRRRGETIATQEVEDVYSAHPDVLEATAYAVESRFGDDDLKLAVVLKEGRTVTETELFRWSIDRLPYFALPQYIEFRADLPRNELGRVIKRQLRAEGITPATWSREQANIELDRT
jgi:carnitine-CoA ligase